MGENQSPGPGKWPLAITALVVGFVLGGAAVSAYWPNLGPWLLQFIMQNGGGLGAVAAGIFAYLAVSGQISASRDAVEQARAASAQQATDAQAALERAKSADAANSWWQTFEWASNRVAPADPNAIAIPGGTLISTLQQLANDAPSDSLKKACSGIMSIVAAQIRSEIELNGVPQPVDDEVQIEGDAGSSPEVVAAEGDSKQKRTRFDEPLLKARASRPIALDFLTVHTNRLLTPTRAGLFDALNSYVDSAAGTAAESPSASALAWELNLRRELESALPSKANLVFAADETGTWWIIHDLGPLDVVVAPRHISSLDQFSETLREVESRRSRSTPNAAAALVIPFETPKAKQKKATRTFGWHDDSNTEQLVAGLTELANDPLNP